MGKRPPCKLVLHLAVWVRLGEETVGTRAGEPQQRAGRGLERGYVRRESGEPNRSKSEEM